MTRARSADDIAAPAGTLEAWLTDHAEPGTPLATLVASIPAARRAGELPAHTLGPEALRRWLDGRRDLRALGCHIALTHALADWRRGLAVAGL